MYISRILFFISSIVILCSCNRWITTKSASFSTQELEMIRNGKADESMRVFLITEFQDSILLRKSSEKLRLPNKDTDLQLFSKRLLATMRDSAHLGVGIAAPQVGILKRIIWVQRFDKEGYPFEVFYNPTIKKYSIDKQDCQEGCLSIPNKTGVTKTRAFSIELEHENLDGKIVKESVEGFTAVIFQHEIDHLDGILFLDHLKADKAKTN